LQVVCEEVPFVHASRFAEIVGETALIGDVANVLAVLVNTAVLNRLWCNLFAISNRESSFAFEFKNGLHYIAKCHIRLVCIEILVRDDRDSKFFLSVIPL